MLFRSDLRVANHGYLGTCGPASAQGLPHVEPLRLSVRCEGPTLLSPSAAVVEIGHLQGWGRGLHGGTTVFAPWTRGNAHERFITLLVAGSGQVHLEVGSCRVGLQQQVVEVA